MAKEIHVASLTYEQGFQELEDTVKQLEAEIQNLDQALLLFERGQALAKHCADLLEKAELKVQQLGEDGDLQMLD
jgi:exodeoxyribonuclease VII small subunit